MASHPMRELEYLLLRAAPGHASATPTWTFLSASACSLMLQAAHMHSSPAEASSSSAQPLAWCRLRGRAREPALHGCPQCGHLLPCRSPLLAGGLAWSQRSSRRVLAERIRPRSMPQALPRGSHARALCVRASRCRPSRFRTDNFALPSPFFVTPEARKRLLCAI